MLGGQSHWRPPLQLLGGRPPYTRNRRPWYTLQCRYIENKIFLSLNLGLKYEIQVPNIGGGSNALWPQSNYWGFTQSTDLWPPLSRSMPWTTLRFINCSWMTAKSNWLIRAVTALDHYTVCSKKHPLLFSCIALRKSNQFEMGILIA